MSEGIEELSSSLNSIVVSLGDSYSFFTAHLPSLLKKLEEGLESISKDYNLEDNQADIARLKLSIEDKTHKVHGEMDRYKTHDLKFFNKLKTESNKMNLFIKSLEKIEFASGELGIISLNAMIVSLKAGSNGGAFPVITKELQKNSRELLTLSNMIKNRGDLIKKSSDTLIKTVKDERALLFKEVKNLIYQIDSKIEVNDKNIKRYELLNQLFFEGVQTMKPFVYTLLEDLQNHDIIRQSTDHINHALNQKKNFKCQTIEERLDFNLFCQEINRVSILILEEIQETLNKTCSLFKNKYSLIKNIRLKMPSLLEDSHSLSTEKNNIVEDEIFLLIEERKKNNLDGITKSNSEILLNQIQDILSKLDFLNNKLSWMEKIYLSSCIEAVKVKKIEKLDVINSDMEIQLRAIKEEANLLKQTVGSYQEGIIQIFNQVPNSNGIKSEVLFEVGETLIGDFKSFDRYFMGLDNLLTTFSHLIDDFKLIEEKLEKGVFQLDSIVQKIENLRISLEADSLKKNSQFNTLLDMSPYSSWESDNQEIEKLVGKFTIFHHKKILQEEETIIDSSLERGEVLLF